MLLVLQIVQVGILWLHDWLKLGPLNDARAARDIDGTGRLIVVTVVQSLPFTLFLAASMCYGRASLPLSLRRELLFCYALLLVGEIRAWWWPYLVRADPRRAARYRSLFGKTHAFLPQRNGMVPNTLHCALHAATAATCLMLAAGMI
ncbi:hypothetical protein [Gluconacetobacter sacchari]|uniref:Uncharacterized protein n=1 Tax=Gluconacetobacter sacchari TaxID=92759 RepID=A0A7W4NPJ5_9PROT|nr:hypothetical protein [Gluconacetobacter sacchari]MBB2159163.1 hypothetical protein [Gluconacetobacter sacchari]